MSWFRTARTLGVQGWQKQNNLSWLVFLSKDFGQDLFNPNIAGWPTGKQWLVAISEKRMSKLKVIFQHQIYLKKNLSEEQQNKISEYQITEVDIRPINIVSG